MRLYCPIAELPRVQFKEYIMSGSLKEFDKWLNDDKCSLRSYPECNHRELCIAEDAWKAALEWVARRGMHHYGNDFLTDMNELSTEIRIELGMLNERGEVRR